MGREIHDDADEVWLPKFSTAVPFNSRSLRERVIVTFIFIVI